MDITADYAFGHALERDTSAVVTKNSGKVLGSVKVPLNNQDFSSFLLRAQQSKAKIIGLANAGSDTNSIKQAASSASSRAARTSRACSCSSPTCTRWDCRRAGPHLHRDVLLGHERPDARLRQAPSATEGIHPTMVHAGVYAGVSHYLKAVEALKSDDGTKVDAKMKEVRTIRCSARAASGSTAARSHHGGVPGRR
ncbi:MAG: ABC transporter substrate-binding protein [Burkholderiales bacterium]